MANMLLIGVNVSRARTMGIWSAGGILLPGSTVNAVSASVRSRKLTPGLSSRLARAYLCAKEAVVSEGYGSEIDWQAQVSLDSTSETDFLREATWVILASGLHEQCVRRVFPEVGEALLRWVSAEAIVDDLEGCRSRALTVFRNERKIGAVLRIACHVNDIGFSETQRRIRQEGISFIRCLPYMGPATSYHLAKNIGLDVAKPDRHLVRIAALAGYEVGDLCREISIAVGDRVPVVDVVLWRFANLHRDYLDVLKNHLLQDTTEGDI